MSVHFPDRGPWHVGDDGSPRTVHVQSDDFSHDVRLYITGDFETPADRLAYAAWLAGVLTLAGEP